MIHLQTLLNVWISCSYSSQKENLSFKRSNLQLRFVCTKISRDRIAKNKIGLEGKDKIMIITATL